MPAGISSIARESEWNGFANPQYGGKPLVLDHESRSDSGVRSWVDTAMVVGDNGRPVDGRTNSLKAVDCVGSASPHT